MKTIYFVRHGESEANIGIFRSADDHSTLLTENGRQQARKTGEYLKDRSIELIVSSPFVRTVDTANIIASSISYSSKNIVTNPLFTEREFGIYYGRANDEFLANLDNNKWHESIETTKELHRRIREGLKWLKSQGANSIVLVSHGAAGRMIQAIHQQLPHSEMHKLKLLDNAEIYEFIL
jgi:broad specificity phosphatase PhoE